jgi:hypothetical protein
MVENARSVVALTSSGRVLARRRRARRARRGLTVFIVLLVIGMLFAIGTFAAKMSSAGVANSGRFRQMVQTHYISDMGMQASLAELQRDPNGYRIMMRDLPPPGSLPGEFPCKETPDPDTAVGPLKPANPACVRIGYRAFETVARTTTSNVNLDIFESKGAAVNNLPGAPGSLGLGNVAGNFAAELSDLMVDAPPPGFPAEQASHMAFYRVTILATGQVLPTNAAGTPFAMGSDQFEFMVSQEDTRAQVVFGPVPK